MEKLEKLKNSDIYWLALVYILIFLAGPFGLPILAIAWVWSFIRHNARQDIVDELIEIEKEKVSPPLA